MPSTAVRPLSAIALCAAAAVALAACGGSDESSDAASDASSATTAVASGCAESTELTVTTDEGPVTLDAVAAYADVTLDQSASFTITNYSIEQSEAESIYNPTLTGDQLGVTFYLSSSGDDELEATTYVEAADDPEATYVLNTASAYDATGRIIASGVDLPAAEVELTAITEDELCGTVTTPEFSGEFVAVRI